MCVQKGILSGLATSLSWIDKQFEEVILVKRGKVATRITRLVMEVTDFLDQDFVGKSHCGFFPRPPVKIVFVRISILDYGIPEGFFHPETFGLLGHHGG